MSASLTTSLRILNRTIQRHQPSAPTVELDKDAQGFRPSVRGHFIAPRMSAKECERFLDGASSLMNALGFLSAPPAEDAPTKLAAARDVLFPGGDRSNEFTPEDLERVADIIR